MIIDRLETWDLDCRRERDPNAWYEEYEIPIVSGDNIERIVEKINELVDAVNGVEE